MALLPILALLAGAGIAAGVLQTISDNPPASTAEAAEQRDTGSVLLRAADHVGRPVDEVSAELTALGLVVELNAEPSAAVPADQVTGISPTGRQLRAGDVVVVRYAVPLPRVGSSTRTGTAPREALVTDPAPRSDDTAGEVTTEEPTTSEPTVQAGQPSTTPTAPVTPVTPVDPGPSEPGTTEPDPGTTGPGAGGGTGPGTGGGTGPGTGGGTGPGTTEPEPDPTDPTTPTDPAPTPTDPPATNSTATSTAA
jgi:serine/threonine-protein kinase